jgi:ubiquinone/menaquinone biosynthesis C-methylase UbiE
MNEADESRDDAQARVTWKLTNREQSLAYEEHRFQKRRRMRRLDRLEKAFADDLVSRLEGKGHVLDIPCGNGRFLEIFAAVDRVTMIDVSENMLGAIRYNHHVPDNAALLRGDILSIPLADEQADLCFCMRLFHHMRDDLSRLVALTELTRVSRRFVALTFYNQHSGRYIGRRSLFKKIRGGYTTYARMTELARQVGLRPVVRRPRVNWVEQQCLVLFEKQGT